MSDFVLNIETAQNIISSRKMITRADKYNLKVTNVTMHNHATRGLLAICNYNARSAFHTATAMELGAKGDLQGAINQQFSSSQRVGKDFVPTKGSIVSVMIEDVITKDGDSALFITSVEPIIAAKATKVAFSFAPQEETEPVVTESAPVVKLTKAQQKRADDKAKKLAEAKALLATEDAPF